MKVDLRLHLIKYETMPVPFTSSGRSQLTQYLAVEDKDANYSYDLSEFLVLNQQILTSFFITVQ